MAAFLISAMPLVHWIIMIVLVQFAVWFLYQRVVVNRVAAGAEPMPCLGQWFGLQGVAILFGLVAVTLFMPEAA